jgi:DNA-binding transcriptional MerR regulator
MTQDEIRVLLRFRDSPSESCENVNALLDNHIGHVADRIRELQQLESSFRHCAGKPRRPAKLLNVES